MNTCKIAFSSFFFVAAVTALSAQAETGFRFQPYAGLEYQHTILDYRSIQGSIELKDTFNGGALYLGARLHDNFGIELGYNRTREGEKINHDDDSNIGLKISSFTFDTLGYLPLDTAKKVELIGSIGLARTKASLKFHDGLYLYNISDNETKTDLRLGFGAQYEVFDNFRVRSMLRWENTKFDDIDNGYLLSLGFNYSF